jgi:hypothetical protein
MLGSNGNRWKVAKLGDYFRIKHGYAFKGEFFSEKGPFVLNYLKLSAGFIRSLP